MTPQPLYSTRSCLLALCVLTAACSQTADAGPTRETLSNGTVVVTYPALDQAPSDTLEADLRIGKVDGEPWETFGAIRALEAGPDGRIYVLDQQAAEIRVFGPDGAYLATLSHRGEGPGEIREANGLILGPDGTLWVQDYRARALLALSVAESREIARHPMLASGYGFEWDAVLGTDGVIRQTWFHSDAAPDPSKPTGLLEMPARLYIKSYDPRTGVHDSLFVAADVSRFLRFQQGNGFMNTGVPQEGRRLSAIDRGGSIWIAMSDAYQLVSITAAGDTTLIVRAEAEGPPVSKEDLTRAEGLFRQAGVEPNVPKQKPVLQRLFTDDSGRLWVERTRPDAKKDARRLDVYDREGEFLGAVQLPSNVSATTALVIRGGHLYAVAQDDLEVSYVVRIPLPALIR